MLPANEYLRRRRRLCQQLKGGTVVLRSAPPPHRNGDQDYPFRQHSAILYLCGYPHECVFVLSARTKKSILFIPQRTPKQALWMGAPERPADIRKRYGIDEVRPIQQAEGYRTQISGVIHSVPRCNIGRYCTKQLQDALVTMRLIKSDAEIEVMQQAVAATRQALREVDKLVKPGVRIARLHAAVESVFAQHRADHAFAPIITTNGETLHAAIDDGVVRSGDVVLVDIGAEIDGYAADMTRCFIAGKASAEAKKVIQIATGTQKHIIGAIKPNINIKDLQSMADGLLIDGLTQLGVLGGSADDIKNANSHRLFFPHGIGHHVGVDVHDCVDMIPALKRFGPQIAKDAVITVEPGLYFNKTLLNDKEIRKQHKQTVDFERALELSTKVSGVRIEDMVKVGSRVLKY